MNLEHLQYQIFRLTIKPKQDSDQMSLNLQQMYTTINDAGKIGYENIRKFTFDSISHQTNKQKIQRELTGLNTKPKTIKLACTLPECH